MNSHFNFQRDGEVRWPACGEIDILEFVGLERGVVHANIHTRKYNHVAKTGMGVGDIDLFECNEAMGSIMPMWQREFDVPLDKVNVNGSGISLGHPVGATGARLITTAFFVPSRSSRAPAMKISTRPSPSMSAAVRLGRF